MAYNKKKIKDSIAIFIKQYKRKSTKCFDPNDRSYDRKLGERIKKMNPEELSKLMNDDD